MDLTERDAVDTSVDDSERAEEVELTAHLIVAANESLAALTQEQIDRILGVPPRT